MRPRVFKLRRSSGAQQGAYLTRQRSVNTLAVDTRLEEHKETIPRRFISCEQALSEQHAQQRTAVHAPQLLATLVLPAAGRQSDELVVDTRASRSPSPSIGTARGFAPAATWHSVSMHCVTGIAQGPAHLYGTSSGAG